MKVRIATYNCKNYFLSPESTSVKPARERRALARVINTVNADILCLQEVENRSVLDEINQNLSNPYDYCLVENGNSNRGINVGIMSRLIFDGQSHKETHLKGKNKQLLYDYQTERCKATKSLSAVKFQRDLFLTEFNIKGKTLLLFNTHLKSRRNYQRLKHDADTIRWSEASMIREILSQYISKPDCLVLLAGDLNQRNDGESIKPLTDWAELRDPIYEDIEINDPAATTFHSKPKERIDYVLPALNLYDYYVPGSAKIHKSTIARKASDHFPVSIDFEF